MKVLIVAANQARYAMYRGLMKLRDVETVRVSSLSDIFGYSDPTRIVYKDFLPGETEQIRQYAQDHQIKELEV